MNNFNQHNQHGNNIMNFGPQPRELNQELKLQLKSIIPSSAKVNIASVLGDGEAYNFAHQIKYYLTDEGYKVDGVDQVVYSSPISGQIIEQPKNNQDSYKILIGNKK